MQSDAIGFRPVNGAHFRVVSRAITACIPGGDMLGKRGAFILASSILAAAITVVEGQQQQPQAPPPAGQQGQGGFPGRGAPMWEADFSKKGTVPVLSPADEAKKIWMQPGFKLDPVLSDPDIQEP